MEQSGRAEQLLAGVGEALHAQLDHLDDAMTKLLLDRIPALPGDGPMVRSLRASVRGNLVAAIRIFRDGEPVEDMPVPEVAREYARSLAQRGASPTALIRAYRVGQQLALERSIEAIGSQEASRAETVRAIQLLITLNFAYIDSISEQVMAEYQAERERWLSHRRTVRMEVLERLLGPYPPDTDTAESVLGYALRQQHLGLVLWTGSTIAEPARLTGLEDIVARIAETLRATEHPLIWPRDSNTLWAWIPWRPTLSRLDEDQLAEILRTEADDVRLALGAPGNDVEGFRQTHNDAIRAARVASIADRHARPITSYTDPGVRTAALLSADLDAAQRMVGAALGPLAADEPATALLRETVRVFLDEKGSYVAAAARLHVHKNTVKYRLARAVERRGAPIESDRLDVELALVAAHWLGPSVLTPAPEKF